MQASKPLMRVAALGTVLLLAACATPPQAATEPRGVPTHAELSGAVHRALEGQDVPGGAIIVTGPGAAETLLTFGDADREAPGETGGESREVADGTRFAYRSITKSFVGTVIMQLADEGKLALDDPISRYVDGVPGGDGVTIADLGDMRSGLANYSASPQLGELLVSAPDREPRTSELLDLAYPDSPVFDAGTAYEYSNTNTLLLGETIERITGKPWQEAVRQRILRPLRLDSVHYGFTDPQLDARGFQFGLEGDPERLPQAAPGWFGAAGALTGDIRDLATWGTALGSGALIDAATHSARLSVLGSIADDPKSPEYDRYGFALGEIDGWVGHTGNGLGFQALTMHDAGSGRTVAVLINGTGADPDLPAHMFREILADMPPR
ncbi:serine hydrolase [Leucobacter sp. gxy201]|uniref:serine hydrolase domain-containing protein n=1 Tax=Leucobacter sp. gxy201 TaxID=2957200 RepID=UPI003DA0F518